MLREKKTTVKHFVISESGKLCDNYTSNHKAIMRPRVNDRMDGQTACTTDASFLSANKRGRLRRDSMYFDGSITDGPSDERTDVSDLIYYRADRTHLKQSLGLVMHSDTISSLYTRSFFLFFLDLSSLHP